VLPLHPELSACLRSGPRGIVKAPVFVELAGKGTGGRHGLSGHFKSVMERAGIVSRIVRKGAGAGRQTSNLSFHSLRHAFVSALANAGVAADLRQKLSGHADERTHAVYTHHEIEALRAAVSKMPGIENAMPR
jgi:integrase